MGGLERFVLFLQRLGLSFSPNDLSLYKVHATLKLHYSCISTTTAIFIWLYTVHLVYLTSANNYMLALHSVGICYDKLIHIHTGI